MSDNFVAEIRIFPFGFAPRGWALCDGQLLPISQNTALFSLLGTTYGGDGRTTFALPDLRRRVPVPQGAGPVLSGPTLPQAGGEESAPLTSAQLPARGHGVQGSGAATSKSPSGLVPGFAGAGSAYGAPD